MIEKAKFNVNFNIVMCLNRTIHPSMLHTVMEAHVLTCAILGSMQTRQVSRSSKRKPLNVGPS